jgi:hypothetical protein
LISLTLFLVLLPLTVTKPGLPVSLKADEAAFYLASLSVWHDGDLICDDLDARRLFQEYSGTNNLILMSKGGGQPVYFGVPILYPLLASPVVALFGANGMVMLNAALLVAMMWMGVDYLRCRNGELLSILFAAGFFLLSTVFVYVFWLQPEVFYMACVMGAFYLIERAVGGSGDFADRVARARFPGLHAAGAAALLATVSYSKPMLVVLALPILYRLFRARSWRGLVTFVASGLLTVVAVAAIAYGLTEQVWPYFAPRAGISLSSPVDYMERRVAQHFPARSVDAPTLQISRGGKEVWVTMITILRDAVPEFLFGRHGGFFPYMPFAVLSILIFLLHGRRSMFRWLILASAVSIAVLFVTGVRGQWLGGGGFVGNRYFASVYPAFFFLIRRVHPPWLTALGYAAAGIFLGPLLITPLGAPVKEPTLQAHVRNQPFPRLPMEWSLARRLAGYRYISQGGISFHGRRDEIAINGDEIWVTGAKRVEMNLLSQRQDQSFVFDIRNLAEGNEIEICLGKDCRMLTLDNVPENGAKRRLTFEPQHAHEVPRPGRRKETFRYRLTVDSTWGEQPRWRGSGEESFYLGAAITFVGSTEDLARDLYSVEWLRVQAPSSMEAGSSAAVQIDIRNSSAHTWSGTGASRVRVAYHWLSEAGDTVVRGGRRTELPSDVRPGKRIETEMVVDAPESPGRYVLALDLLRERVSWFSKKDEELAHRISVEVVAPAAGSESTED